MKQFLALVIISLFCLNVATASAEEITPISKELQNFLSLSFNTSEYKPLSMQERRNVAKMLLDKARDFDAHVPELKAETKSLVEQEMNECKGARCNTLYSSNEFVNYGLKNNSSALVEVLNNLYNSIGSDPYLEMYYWSLAVTFFRDRTIFEDYERLHGLSYLQFKHELGTIRANLIGAAINSGIIRQFLQEQYSVKKNVSPTKANSANAKNRAAD